MYLIMNMFSAASKSTKDKIKEYLIVLGSAGKL